MSRRVVRTPITHLRGPSGPICRARGRSHTIVDVLPTCERCKEFERRVDWAKRVVAMLRGPDTEEED